MIPQCSTLSVSIDREKIEEIRKNRGIPIRVLEQKINLSKSRYYRWLQYQIDLPMELLINLKKLLNLTDWELQNLFEKTTDEQIEMLTLVIYLTKFESVENKRMLCNIKERIEKYRASQNGNTPYKLILYYIDLWEAYCGKKDVKKCLRKFELYFMEVDYLTFFDTFLYLSILDYNMDYLLKNSSLSKEIIFLEKELLRKISRDNLGEWSAILIGCIIDLSYFYWRNNLEKSAYFLILKAQESLSLSKQLDKYNKEILDVSGMIYNVEKNKIETQGIEQFKEKFKSIMWVLPECDILFFNNLLSLGEINE